MEKMYLVTIPAKNPQEKPEQFVVKNLSSVTGKFDFFMIQSIDVYGGNFRESKDMQS